MMGRMVVLLLAWYPSVARADVAPIGDLLMLPFLILLAVLTVMCIVFMLLACFSGWTALHEKYRTTIERPEYAQKELIFVGRVRYRRLVYLASLEEGVHCSMPALFSFSHPRLLIPWEDIEVSNSEASSLQHNMLNLKIGNNYIVLQDELWEDLIGKI